MIYDLILKNLHNHILYYMIMNKIIITLLCLRPEGAYISGEARVPVVQVLQVPHYPCRLIACQYEVEIRIYYFRPFGKIRLWACTCKQEPPLYYGVTSHLETMFVSPQDSKNVYIPLLLFIQHQFNFITSAIIKSHNRIQANVLCKQTCS